MAKATTQAFKISGQGKTSTVADTMLASELKGLTGKLEKAKVSTETPVQGVFYRTDYTAKSAHAKELQVPQFRVQLTDPANGWQDIEAKARSVGNEGDLTKYTHAYHIEQQVGLTAEQMAATQTTPTSAYDGQRTGSPLQAFVRR